MNRKLISLVLVIAMLVGSVSMAFAQGQQEAAGAKTIELRLGHIYDPSHPWNKGAELAVKRAAELSTGRIKITNYPAGQLGTELELQEQMLLGSIDIVVSGAGQVGSIYSPVNVLEMPYTFKDNQHVLAFAESDLGKALFEGYRKKFGGRIIGPSSYGIRQMATDRPVRTPADLAGFKLRVPEQTVTMAYGRAMGANPTPIAFSEAYMALQQGVVNGLENPLSAIYAQKFHEVTSHIILTSHVTNACFFVMNDKKFLSLSAEDQAIILQAFKEGSKLIVDVLDQEDRDLVAEFQKAGKTVITPDLDAFRRATANMPRDFAHWWADEFGADFHSKIQNLKY